ncbi:MAG: FKBP-type peptidyl-prolyl cis-trans isomerase [Balneolales bacterium]
MKLYTLFALSFIFLLSSCFRDDDEIDYDNAEDLAFLEENAGREGVTVTESGLQYRVLEKGEGGEKPTANSEVSVHYTGSLINGEEFNNSYELEEPATFFINRVIYGFAEGLMLMEEGDVYELVIPAELAYGNNPPGSPIYPGATLIFEMELIEIL